MNSLRKLFFFIIASAVVIDALFDFLAFKETATLADSGIRNQILIVSGIDLLLMAAAAALWISFDRANRRNEALLRSAIARSEKVNQELQQAIARRTRQLRNTIHDLKNPLGSIRGFSDLIAEDHDNPTSVVELSQSVQRLSDHTLELVNSILEIESSETSQQDSKAKVSQVLQSVCDALSPQVLKKNQTLDFDLEINNEVVDCSPVKLWDVFTNLVGNAVKFSPIDGKIQVKARVAEQKLIVEIEDSGPGFSQSDKKKALVAPGPLSAKPTGDEVSTGLGLHSSYNFVRKVGGDIKIADRKSGQGARVIVELPAASAT